MVVSLDRAALAAVHEAIDEIFAEEPLRAFLVEYQARLHEIIDRRFAQELEDEEPSEDEDGPPLERLAGRFPIHPTRKPKKKTKKRKPAK